MAAAEQRECCDTTTDSYHRADCPTGRGVVGVVTHERCNAMCADDRHFQLHESVTTTGVDRPGEGWTEVGYLTEDGVGP